MGQPRRIDQGFNPPPATLAPSGAAGTFRGRLVTVFGSNGGIFVYSPTPGANQLVSSIVAAAGTDQYGNKVLAGDTVYQLGTPAWSAVNIVGNGLTYYTNSVAGQSGTWTQMGEILFQAHTSPQLVLPSGYTGTIAASQADATTFTDTGTSATRMSKQWDVPANDAQVNTVYRFTVFGNATQGTSANNSSWNISFGIAGSVINLNIPSANFPANLAVNFYLQLNFQFTAIGASGNANAFGVWLMTNASTGAAVYAASLIDLTNTIDTTADSKLQWNWQWQTNTGGPTITSYGSTFERISG